MTDVIKKIDFIRLYDPDGAARLDRLLGKKDVLKRGNAYGERFTDRQFSLVFIPLLDAAFGRAQVLEALSKNESTVAGLSAVLSIEKGRIFDHIKEMMKKNMIEIAGHDGRDPRFRRKTP